MARLNREQRADVLRYARQLVSAGASRRRIAPILQKYSYEKYGVAQGIGKATHSTLFRERATILREQAEGRPSRYRLRLNRQDRYNWLRDNHFTHAEALRLSHLRKLKSSTGVNIMIQERKPLWVRFDRKAIRMGWGKTRRTEEWRAEVAAWYRKKNYITKGIHQGKQRATVWGWYKSVQNQLPVADKDDTPRLHDRGFTTRQHVTPQLVDWTKSLNSIRRLMEDPKHRKDMPVLRQEERRALAKIREIKRR